MGRRRLQRRPRDPRSERRVLRRLKKTAVCRRVALWPIAASRRLRRGSCAARPGYVVGADRRTGSDPPAMRLRQEVAEGRDMPTGDFDINE